MCLSDVLTHAPQVSTWCVFGDAFLLTTMLKSAYLIYYGKRRQNPSAYCVLSSAVKHFRQNKNATHVLVIWKKANLGS